METAVEGASIQHGATGEGAPVVLVGGGALGAWQWSWHHPALAGPYDVVTVEPRGHGGSSGLPTSVPELAADLEAVLRARELPRVHLVGFGLGGATALAYAAGYGRARTLTLIGTPPAGEDVDVAAFEALFEPPALAGLLSERALAAESGFLEQVEKWFRADRPSRALREATGQTLASFDPGALYELVLPTLVLQGVADPVVPAAAGEQLGTALPNGRTLAVAGRRLAHLESATAVSDELRGFLDANPL
jgi:pimeloyl-ACP methyl ester carboxylesterase